VRQDDCPATALFDTLVAELVEENFTVRLYQENLGWRLAYSDTGTYDVFADGASIIWYPGPAPVPELVQSDILGRVLALALTAAGAMPLHGSAVALDQNSVIVLGKKSSGKSTFAAALTAAGARLISDDMAAVEIGAEVQLRPGVPQLRLCAEAAHVFTGADITRTNGLKDTFSHFPSDQVELRTTSLRAIYVLEPVSIEADGLPFTRTRMTPTEASLALLVHGKMGGLMGGRLVAASMLRAAQIVRRIPVYSLRVVRDLERLPALASEFLSWHAKASEVALEPQ
jgi:hypothetical protein